MIEGTLQDFVANGMARGRISFGDVRRLRRSCLPDGIRDRQQAAALISLNASLDRADKTWGEWLVAAMADFVASGEGADGIDDAGGEWLELLLAATKPATNLGRRIARQIRRELARLRYVQAKGADESCGGNCDLAELANETPNPAFADFSMTHTDGAGKGLAARAEAVLELRSVAALLGATDAQNGVAPIS